MLVLVNIFGATYVFSSLSELEEKMQQSYLKQISHKTCHLQGQNTE